MIRFRVHAVGLAALLGACALSSEPATAGHLQGWTPKKKQREWLHPWDCQFGYYGTNWRAWPAGCDQTYGCQSTFAPPMNPAMWPPTMMPGASMSPLPTMPPPNWQPPQPEPVNPWSSLPPVPQMNAPMSVPNRGPQFPAPVFGSPSYGPLPGQQPAPALPSSPSSQPPLLPTAPPAALPDPNSVPPIGQRVPVPPMPTTRVPAPRGNSAVIPAGGTTRGSVPATLSTPEFGPSAIQPMSYSAPARPSGPTPKPTSTPPSRPSSPVMLLRPEF